MNGWWSEHGHAVATALLIAAAAWLLAQFVRSGAVWVRAWVDAHGRGCTACGGARVDAVAYPATGPAAYCRGCLLAVLAAGADAPPPVVGLRRPVDPVDALAWVVLAVLVAPLVALLMVLAAR